jgi:site-specific recombinase XerD
MLPDVQERSITLVVDNSEFMRGLERAYMDQATMDVMMQWHEAYERWLARYKSPSTKRAYRESWTEFFTWAKRFPWQVLSSDAIAWQQHLEEKGLAAASINRYLAALSSFYSFVKRDLRRQDDGTERSIFVDDRGRNLENPFRAGTMERKKQGPTTNVAPLSSHDLKAIRQAINPATRTGARDLALYECYLRTGRRLKEIVRLRWRDIQPTAINGEYKFWWTGKGADRNPGKKTGWRVMPKLAYDAIVAYLKADGRWPVTDDEMFIFQPLSDRGTERLPRLAGQELEANRHISPGHVNGIIKKLARRAGIDDSRVHTHTLRHSFAYHLYKQTKDVKLVQGLLDHEDLKTTLGYLESMEEPHDDFSGALQTALGF